MISIKLFPYRMRCDVNRCGRLGKWSVGEDTGPKGTRVNYCTEHLIQLGKVIILKFPDEFPTGNIAEIEAKDKTIADLKVELDAKTTAHKCLKEQLEELKKPKAPVKKKS